MFVDVILDRNYEPSYVPAFQTTYICRDKGDFPYTPILVTTKATYSAPYESGGFYLICNFYYIACKDRVICPSVYRLVLLYRRCMLMYPVNIDTASMY